MVSIDAYKQAFNDWCTEFDDRMTQRYSFASKAKEAGVRPSYLVIGIVVFLTLFTLWKCGQNTTSNIIGFVYPTYESFRALRSEETFDDTQWLIYWTVYSFFVCAESLTDVFLNWIPLYYLWKSLFLIWMMHPTTLGAKVLYDNVIDPLLTKVEQGIEAVFDENKRSELKAQLTKPENIMKAKDAIPTAAKEDAKKLAQKSLNE